MSNDFGFGTSSTHSDVGDLEGSKMAKSKSKLLSCMSTPEGKKTIERHLQVVLKEASVMQERLDRVLGNGKQHRNEPIAI